MKMQGCEELSQGPVTLDCTSALWSFCSSSAADLVSSFLAAMCSAGSRTLPLVSFSSRMATAWLCPCCSATARGVKPSWGAGNRGCSAQPDGPGEPRRALRAHQLRERIPSCFPSLRSISRDVRLEAQHFNSFKHLQKAFQTSEML